jgi:hypothetical protein
MIRGASVDARDLVGVIQNARAGEPRANASSPEGAKVLGSLDAGVACLAAEVVTMRGRMLSFDEERKVNV